MIPVVLEAIYRLRCGIYDLAFYLHEHDDCKQRTASKQIGADSFETKRPRVSESHERFNTILSRDPSLKHLANICDKAASFIVKAVQHVDGTSDFDAKVRTDACRQWLVSLQ
jgi:hypothetical protein